MKLKPPLSSVLLSLDSLEQNLGSQHGIEINEDIDIARKEIYRVKIFINNFLKFANLSNPLSTRTNLKDLVDQSQSKFSNYISKGINFEINLDDDIYVIVDPFQIVEVFQVLIENAIDATEGKGEIKINAKIDEQYAFISIKDNGTGIDSNLIDQIFQPYMTTKEEGTGMGLAIAEKIIRDHGGYLKVNSKKNIGTEFIFNLKRVI